MRNQVEGKSDLLFLYDLKTEKEKQLYKAKSGVFVPVGWTTKGDQMNNILPFDSQERSEGSIKSLQLLDFNLPWTNGTPYCVSRTGTPPPSGGSSSNYYCGSPYSGYTPHSYVATDFDSPNFVSDNVLAIASGTITTAQNYCSGGGFGKYVILTHTDGTQSLYAHLNSVYVTVSQQVSKGCPLGDGGNTEVPGNNPNCTNPSGGGDHIHFEYRVGGVKQYATFSECNCIPKQAYQYTSSNVIGPCSNTCGVPTGIYASNITSSSAIIYCNPVSGATKYKIGYKPSYNSSYYYYEVTSLPIYLTNLQSNTTYNYKLAAYCLSYGWSNYSAIYSFTTLTNGSGDPCSNVITIAGLGSSNAKTLPVAQGLLEYKQCKCVVIPAPGRNKCTNIQFPQLEYIASQFQLLQVDMLTSSANLTHGSTGWSCIDDVNSPGTFGNMNWSAGQVIYLLVDDENTSTGTHILP
ncbi:MAG: peptidoglycan DD-metalloendopeptidase family protein [Bacteroidales bacterium]|nr:peptidoglycan DD-metalloendopeptidase family protein [Bacteroidales bacterium]